MATSDREKVELYDFPFAEMMRLAILLQAVQYNVQELILCSGCEPPTLHSNP